MWNVGEAPVDGATDLGFMFLLAAVRTSFGVDAQTAALIVNSLAFLAVAGGMFVFDAVPPDTAGSGNACVRPLRPSVQRRR